MESPDLPAQPQLKKKAPCVVSFCHDLKCLLNKKKTFLNELYFVVERLKSPVFKIFKTVIYLLCDYCLKKQM